MQSSIPAISPPTDVSAVIALNDSLINVAIAILTHIYCVARAVLPIQFNAFTATLTIVPNNPYKAGSTIFVNRATAIVLPKNFNGAE